MAEPAPIADDTFARRLMVLVAVGVLALLLWQLAEILLLLFGSVLVAVVLRALANPIRARTGVRDRLAVAIAGAIILALVAGALASVGPTLAAELRSVARQLPGALSRVTEALDIGSLGDLLRGASPASTLNSLATRALSWGTTIVAAATGLVLVIFGGIYLALDPPLYRQGFVKLVPPPLQVNVAATIDDCGTALIRWLGGQLVAMLAVGVATGVGLWLVGVPSALALGLIAGLLEFVPFIGPLLAAVPALLLASTVGPETVLWALLVLVVVQQAEGNLLMPMVASKAVSVLPVVGIFAVAALGTLLGPLGLLLGYPLAICADIAIRRLYIRDALDEPVQILGEPAAPSAERADEVDSLPPSTRERT